MTVDAIEAIYILDTDNVCIVEHVYRGRPPAPKTLLPLFLAHAAPRPSVLYLPETNPACTLFSLTHSGLAFLVPSSTEVEPLFVFELLHRLIDVLEEFLGPPLLASRIESSYHVVAQLLSEMVDAGAVSNTEPNALHDVVETQGWADRLLGGIGLPGASQGLGQQGPARAALQYNPANNGPAIPWRRANVRHTSNELYVDIIETLSVILAPSGRPLAAFAHGSILFNAKISGVPDLILVVGLPSGQHTINRVLEGLTFHPCVRLARWRDHPGEFSFVPPDGKFVLAGYTVNLVPAAATTTKLAKQLDLPMTIEVLPSLGPAGLDFEVRLQLSSLVSGSSSSGSNFDRSGLGSRGSGRSTPNFFGNSATSTSASPTLHNVVVTVPIPRAVRNIVELRASRGEAVFVQAESQVEWRLSSKDTATAGRATLRCTVTGPLEHDGPSNDAVGGDQAVTTDAPSNPRGFQEYDENEVEAYQTASQRIKAAAPPAKPLESSRDERRVQRNAMLMPRSAAVSFGVRGWLASGLRVESLQIDARKSRGLGKGVRPVKGAKYMTISRKGIETRC